MSGTALPQSRGLMWGPSVGAALGLLVAFALVVAGCATLLVPEQARADTPSQAVYRLYNQYDGDHLITTDVNEYNSLEAIGWTKEGVQWHAPTTGKPIYRLYNQYNGEHFYTLDKGEYDRLKGKDSRGRVNADNKRNTGHWTGEGVKLYSGGDVPVYRLFNQYATIGTHLYTTKRPEYDSLKGRDRSGNIIADFSRNTGHWTGEGTAFYALSVSTPTSGKAGGDTTKIPQESAKYSYQLYSLDPHGYGAWSGITSPVYIKTNNPDPSSISVTDANGRNIVGYRKPSYADIKYLNSSDAGGDLRKVDGGYVTYVESYVPGAYTLQVREASKSGYVIAATAPVYVNDFDAAKSQWEDLVIQRAVAKAGVGRGSSYEKLKAVADYLLDENGCGFKYLTGASGRLYNYAQEANGPFFLAHRWDSLTSPTIMCELATKIGGFKDVHNCYWDYPRGSGGWMSNHYNCRVTYTNASGQPEERYVHACPSGETGEVSLGAIDLTNTSRLRPISDLGKRVSITQP